MSIQEKIDAYHGKIAGDNLSELKAEQARIKSISRLHYPLMKLVDMYFWQIGFERWAALQGPAAIEETPPV